MAAEHSRDFTHHSRHAGTRPGREGVSLSSLTCDGEFAICQTSHHCQTFAEHVPCCHVSTSTMYLLRSSHPIIICREGHVQVSDNLDRSLRHHCDAAPLVLLPSICHCRHSSITARKESGPSLPPQNKSCRFLSSDGHITCAMCM